MEPCAEPENAGMTLERLKVGDVNGAALEHVAYVLDVRDAFGRCNGRLKAIRTYAEAMTKAVGQ